MTDEKLLKNAQYRKAAPMAFLNSRNTAMEMVKMEGISAKVNKLPLLKRVKKYTDDLMADYVEFYAKEVASVGVSYDVKTTIELLNATKTKDELRLVWTALSEDERHDGEIRKLVKELKKKYAKGNN
jgi:hypothetical protein